ncbi:hypothetical protein Taro_010569 [Colocasia esculenta]|uniref:Uncharacterized protein n=1 Tax=Colocasia esculenta TaxID=4460 RepID=A0A843U7B3_COLES|nr:hypothetical protein [Colocasia esculenta]
MTERRVTLAELISLKQNKNESALDYVKRWRDVSMKCEQPPAHEDAVKLCQRSLKPEIKEKLLGANIRTFEHLNNTVAEIEIFFAENPTTVFGKSKPPKDKGSGSREVNVVDFSSAFGKKGGKVQAEEAQVEQLTKLLGFAAYQQLPDDMVEKAIHATFHDQQEETGWIQVNAKKRSVPKKSQRKQQPRKLYPGGAAPPNGIAKDKTLQELIVLRKRIRNQKRNEKRKLKKESTACETSTANGVNGPLKRLQGLIDELEEYQQMAPTKAIPLEKYMPWEELERKMRLKKWLIELREHMQEHGDALSSVSGNEMFWGTDCTVEDLVEKVQTFSCNMTYVFTSQPGEQPKSGIHCVPHEARKPFKTYQRNKPPQKVIYFRGEKSGPVPVPQTKGDEYIFPSSDEEEEDLVVEDDMPIPTMAANEGPSQMSTKEKIEELVPLVTEKLSPEKEREERIGGDVTIPLPSQAPKSLARVMPPFEKSKDRANRKVLQALGRFPTNLSIWDALALSKELREAFIAALQEPEVYEAHVAEMKEEMFVHGMSLASCSVGTEREFMFWRVVQLQVFSVERGKGHNTFMVD